MRKFLAAVVLLLAGSVAQAQTVCSGTANSCGSGSGVFGGAFTAPILGPTADNCTAPPYSFTGDTTTGICSTAAGSLVVRTSGTNRFTVGTATVTSTLVFLGPNGLVGGPTYSFSGDPDSGLYSVAGNNVGIAVGGVERYRFGSGGLLSIAASGIAIGTSVGSPDVYVLREAAAILELGLDAATAIAQTIKGSDSTGSTIAGGSLTLKGGAGTNGIANGGALILAGGAKSSTGEPGAVTISDGGTKPTCAAGIRGAIWYDAGAGGVADSIEICAKSSADAYAWRIMAVIP